MKIVIASSPVHRQQHHQDLDIYKPHLNPSFSSARPLPFSLFLSSPPGTLGPPSLSLSLSPSRLFLGALAFSLSLSLPLCFSSFPHLCALRIQSPSGGGWLRAATEMEFGGGRKRGRYDASLNGNGGFKKSKPEMESLSTGIGSKSKPCTKFFSTSGCPFGEGCHFLHYVPGGFKAVSQLINIGGNQAVPPARNTAVPPSFPDGSSPPAVKTRLCNKYNTAEGCKFGDKCHFAHGEWEIGKPTAPSFDDHHQRGLGPMPGRIGGRIEPPPPAHGPAASFGLSSTAKISVDASLAGAIIGKNGVNSKQICRVTGAKLSIRDHESDPNLRNIELEGTFDQIKQASAMVRELIGNVGSGAGNPMKNHHGHHGSGHSHHPGSNFKTKICDNFTKGSCTFGDRCHFAHGAEELRKPGI